MGFFDSAGGDIVSAVGSLVGTSMTNQANSDRAAEANRFSAEQYANRYQTTVKDLMAAGLNPMLAYSQGPGTSPTGQQAAPAQNMLGNAIDTYNKNRTTTSAIQLQQEQVNQAKSTTHLNNANSAKAEAEAEVAKEQANLLKLQQPKTQAETKTSEELGKMYIQQAGASAAQAKQAMQMVEKIAQENQNLKQDLIRIQQANDQNAPESQIAKKYPTFYYIFHSLMPSLSGSVPNLPRVTNVYK